MANDKQIFPKGIKAFTGTHRSEICCEDVIKRVLEISEEGWNIYHYIERHGQIRVERVAEFLAKDRSTAYRELEKLVNCGICRKERTTIKEGGYYFLYRARSISEIRDETERCIDATYEQLKQAMQKNLVPK